MPGDPEVIWCGTQGPLPPLQVLGAASDGGVGERVVRIILTLRKRRDTGGPTFTNHIQCGGGCGGPPLGVIVSVTGGGGGISNNYYDAAQPAGKKI